MDKVTPDCLQLLLMQKALAALKRWAEYLEKLSNVEGVREADIVADGGDVWMPVSR